MMMKMMMRMMKLLLLVLLVLAVIGSVMRTRLKVQLRVKLVVRRSMDLFYLWTLTARLLCPVSCPLTSLGHVLSFHNVLWGDDVLAVTLSCCNFGQVHCVSLSLITSDVNLPVKYVCGKKTDFLPVFYR